MPLKIPVNENHLKRFVFKVPFLVASDGFFTLTGNTNMQVKQYRQFAYARENRIKVGNLSHHEIHFYRHEFPGHEVRISGSRRMEERTVMSTDVYGDKKRILPHVIHCAGRNVSFRQSWEQLELGTGPQTEGVLCLISP